MKFDSELEEKSLFEAVHNIGEGIFSKIHIIDNSAFPDMKIEYRIYHADGYCWDISMENQYDDNDEEIGPYYDFSENWDGFKKSGIEFAISEIEPILRSIKSKK